MPNRILALDLEGSHLAAVLVETSFRSYQFVQQVAEQRDKGRPLSEQLADFLERNHLEADTVLSALPSRSAAYRILTLPFQDRRKVEQTVPFEIESEVPISLEDAIVDFQILSKDEQGTRVFAAIVPRIAIEEHLQILADAGIDPAAIDFAPLSTLNVLQLFEGDRPDRYAFLHMQTGKATLSLFSAQHLCGLRAIDIPAEAATDSLFREVQWSLQSFQEGSSESQSLTGLALLVAGPISEEAIHKFKSEMGLKIQRLEDLPLRHLPKESSNTQGTFAAAIGLALRGIAEKPTVGVDFRREDYAYKRSQQEIRHNLTRLLALAGVALALFLGSNLLTYQQLAAQYDDLRDAVRKVFVATLPDETTILDETLQLTQAIDGIRQHAQPGGSSTPVLEVLREVSKRAPKTPRMNATELSFDGETLRIRAETVSFEAVEDIKQGLSESTMFREIQVRDPRTVSNGRVEFRLNILFGPERTP